MSPYHCITKEYDDPCLFNTYKKPCNVLRRLLNPLVLLSDLPLLLRSEVVLDVEDFADLLCCLALYSDTEAMRK